MPRRKRLSKRKAELHGQDLLNMAALVGTGPDFGAHDPEFCGPYEEGEARRRARDWLEHRDKILGTLPPPNPDRHWAVTVLDRGEAPPWEPDSRLPEDDPAQERYREHQKRLAAVARSEYARLTGGE